MDLLCLTSNCPSRNGHRGVVDLLLMSERQRKGIEGSGVLNVIMVSLACLALLLGSHSRQKTANLLPLLRRPVMATKWTASVEKSDQGLLSFLQSCYRCVLGQKCQQTGKPGKGIQEQSGSLRALFFPSSVSSLLPPACGWLQPLGSCPA